MRRELEPGETLARCVKCGRIEPPLNERETWHYVVTGQGLVSDCPSYIARKRGQPPCKWEPA